MLPLIPLDKANHFVYGSIVAVVAKTATTLIAPEMAQYSGLVAASAVGVAKELADWVFNLIAKKQGRPIVHSVDIGDAVFTAAGGLPTIGF